MFFGLQGSFDDQTQCGVAVVTQGHLQRQCGENVPGSESFDSPVGMKEMISY